MKKTATCIIALLVLTSCASGSTNSQNEGALSKSLQADCAVPSGWADVAALNPKYVVFGELHGTRESPAFVGRTLCGLAAKGERLLLAIEHSSTHNDRLQAAWSLPADQFRNALPSIGWKGRRDGVASQAMFEMVVQAHGLSQRGYPVDIVAFNGARDLAQREKWSHLPGQGPHEAAQAENIFSAGSAKTYDRVLILVGNYHAMKQPIKFGANEFEPMALRLSKSAKTISLNMRHANGTAWNCLLKTDADIKLGQAVPEEAIDCDNHPAPGYPDLQQSPFIQISSSLGGDLTQYYDGFFWVGSISGSLPILMD